MTNEELQQQIDELKLQLNTLKNTPTFKLLWTAAELQEKMCGIIGNEPYVLGEAVKGAIVQEVAEVVPAPSYNDLTDKPFYEETGMKRVVDTVTDSNGGVTVTVGQKFASKGDKLILTMNGSRFEGVFGTKGTNVYCVIQETRDEVIYVAEIIQSGDVLTISSESYGPDGSGYTKNVPITLDVYATTVHPIEPKFIPAMDSLTLNGADGKQYKVTVDASGVLTATAI